MDNITKLARDMARDNCKSINVKKNGKWKEFVAIVRCKDCKYFECWGPKGIEKFDCYRFIDSPPITPEWYCAWGERKEDAEPVKHGYWEWTDDPRTGDFVCSNCLDHNIVRSRYCPNCGAIMDGERRKDDGNLISNRKCSECLQAQNTTGLRISCSNCGAKMDEVEE